jgi:membrane-associated protein
MSALGSLQVGSLLAYLIAFVIPALDAVFPVLPGETAVIALGVATAGSTDPRIALLVACAAGGAFVGDNLCYLLGRRFGPATTRRFFATPKGIKARAWAERSLERFGPQLIVVCRFIPGGRTAVTLTCGLTGYPRRRFVAATAVAAVIWALYAFFIGRIGGQAFEDNPWAGLVIAFAASVAISAVIEVIRRLLAGWRRRASAEQREQKGHGPQEASAYPPEPERGPLSWTEERRPGNEDSRQPKSAPLVWAEERGSEERATKRRGKNRGPERVEASGELLCHAGQVEPDHPSQDQGDRDELHGRDRVAQEDHADRRRPRGADPGPYRVGGPYLQLAQRNGQQPEAGQRGYREPHRGPQDPQALAQLQAHRKSGLEQSGGN